jgi:hypothetical protein
MMLYALALNPLLVILADRFTGVTLGPSHSKFTCVAYANDVTDIMACRTDINHPQDALQQYERAIGARLNYGKSKALAIGAWNTKDMIISIANVQEVRLLGIGV